MKVFLIIVAEEKKNVNKTAQLGRYDKYHFKSETVVLKTVGVWHLGWATYD